MKIRGGRAQSSPRHACGLNRSLFLHPCGVLNLPPVLGVHGGMVACKSLRFTARLPLFQAPGIDQPLNNFSGCDMKRVTKVRPYDLTTSSPRQCWVSTVTLLRSYWVIPQVTFLGTPKTLGCRGCGCDQCWRLLKNLK